MVRKLKKILIDYTGFLSSDLLWRVEKYVFPPCFHHHTWSIKKKKKTPLTICDEVRADSFSNRNHSGAN